jgi:serine/threonine protein kinase
MNNSNLISKVVGEGGFGCVHNPPLKCKDKSKDPVNKNMVSKLLTQDDADDELYPAQQLSSYLDPEYYFHISPSSSCHPSSIQTNLDAINKCKYFDADLVDDYKLLMQENGGINLVDFENKYAHSTPSNYSRIALEKFWVSMSRIMYGLTQLGRHNQVHHDLKSQNMVYNEDTGQAKMIDFGNMGENKDVETRDLHWNYPPEVKLYDDDLYKDVIMGSQEEKLRYAYVTLFDILNLHTPVLKYIYYEPVDGRIEVMSNKLGQQFSDFILELDGDEKKHTVQIYPGNVLGGFDAFFYMSVKTFDSYGVGLSCVSMINHTKDHLHNSELADELKNLFMNMVNWNLFIRLTPDQIMTTYEGIMQKYGLLEKYNFRFENHKLVEGYIAPLEIKGIKAPDPKELKTIEKSLPMPAPVETIIVPPNPPSISNKTEKQQISSQNGGSINRKSKKRKMTMKRKKQKKV